MRLSTLTLALLPLALAAPLAKRSPANSIAIDESSIDLGHASSPQVVIGGVKEKILEGFEDILRGDDDEEEVEGDDEEEEEVELEGDEEEGDTEDEWSVDLKDLEEMGEEEVEAAILADGEDSEETEETEDDEETSEDTEDTEETEDSDEVSSDFFDEDTILTPDEALALTNAYYTDIYQHHFLPVHTLLATHLPLFKTVHLSPCPHRSLLALQNFLETHSAALWDLTTSLSAEELVQDQGEREVLLAELCAFLCKLGVAGDGLVEKGEGLEELNNILVNLRDALAGAAVTCPCTVENVFRHPVVEERSFEELFGDFEVEFEEEI